jgi:4-amino-4-deoxy-L-arabinose transferase-like glycosyltransferase
MSVPDVAAPAQKREGTLAMRRVASWPALPVLTVIALTAVGFVIRAIAGQQSMFADELSTYWIISTNGVGGVVSTVHSDAEITPPLYFVTAWLTTRIDLAPELARAPSLVAGTASIPVIYLLGLRTVGRPAALVAAAFTTLSPFLIHFSSEARGYALMALLLSLSTLAMLVAVDTRRPLAWAVYAACSCAAVYTHYIAVFVLAAQLLWLLWAHPKARMSALVANIGAAIAVLPWLSGLRADLDSPTTEILSGLSPLTWEYAWDSVSHAAVGYPYGGVGGLPGIPALVMFVLAVIVAVGGVAVGALRSRSWGTPSRSDRRIALVVLIALSIPVGEVIFSSVGTNIFAGRNLIAALPAALLCLARLLIAAGPRLRFATVGLALACFSIGAAKMLQERYQRPDFEAAAAFIDGHAAAGDVVMDAAVLSPGPWSPLDVALGRPHIVVRFNAREQKERPFTLSDPVVPKAESVGRAVAAANGGRLYVVSAPRVDLSGLRGTMPDPELFPPRYRIVRSRVYPGSVDLRLDVWAESG